ncbi:MBL fold metallo-hydrolase [Streptomyces sp. enrichment culture]|uniref:MBL fold metallo-hydrolase n=1 Tax=Streptomyces sp. enrichment culture TaxID=1795815 RepID=UPI003F555CD3
MSELDRCCPSATPPSRRAALGVLAAATAASWSACTTGVASAKSTSATAPSEPTSLSGDAGRSRTRLLLLGTAAGPTFTPGRAGIGSVLVVGDRTYIVDAGLGTARRFGQAGLQAASLAGMFITHLHSDHLFDLFNLLWTTPGALSGPVPIHGPGRAGALPEPYGGKSVPLVDAGHPTPGTADMISGLVAGYAYDMNIRNTESGAQTDHEKLFEAHDIVLPSGTKASATETSPAMRPFRVFEDDRVRVGAILVPHGPVFPSFAFRFDTDEGSVTFSGDTTYSENVARIADGCDILVHEVVDLDWFAANADIMGGYGPGILEHMAQAHTTPRQVGRVASDAGVGQVVLSHLAPGDPRAVTDGTWVKNVRKAYKGKVTAGRDLTQYGVGRRR